MLRVTWAATLACAVLGMCAASSASARSLRLGSAPHRPPGTVVLGSLPSSTQLQLSVALTPRDPLALAAYAAGVSTPGSPDYHHFLTVAQFAERFAPTAAIVSAVTASLHAHGLDPGSVSANGLSIPVRASAAAVGKAFATSLERLAVKGGQTAYANTSPPAIDASVASAVQGVIGLETLSAPHPLALRRLTRSRLRARVASRVATGGPQPCSAAAATATAFPRTFTEDEIASAYNVQGLYAAGNLGAGQTIAVYELEGNFPPDISAFQGCYGTSASVSYEPVDGGPAPPSVQNEDGLETELDVESVIGLAPKANVIVYQGNQRGNAPYDTYNAIIAENRASVIVTSWGACEAAIGSANAQAENTLFQEAAVQGQTVLAASGDQGAQDCQQSTGSTAPAVDDPASQPFVTGVGGTTLTLSPRSETVWNNGAGGVGASGGGNSSLWPMPSYQSTAPPALGVVNVDSSRSCSGLCREVPDVALNADPSTGYVVYWAGNGSPDDSTGWVVVGGTSIGAPSWGALIALTNASPACGSSRVGFANPLLYGAAATNYTGDFNDITAGNNDWLGTNGGAFSARVGYDQATGLGTPIMSSLASALCGDTIQLASPGAQSSIAGQSVHVQLRASSLRGAAITYTGAGLPPGLSLAAATGLITGAPATAGTYTVTVTASDARGATARTTFTWSVRPASLTLTAPRAQVTHALSAVRLQLHASDNNGAAVRYAATRLPRGLTLNGATGIISGTAMGSGSVTVTVTASVTGAPAARVTFTWRILGAPRLTRATLAGTGAGHPRVVLVVAQGTGAAALRSFSVGLPAGLFLGDVGHGLSVIGTRGHGLAYSAVVVRGRLIITLRSPAAQATIVLAAPALQATRSFASSVRSRRVRRVNISVSIQDASRWTTPLSARSQAA